MTNVYTEAQSKVIDRLKKRGIQYQIVQYDANNNETIVDDTVYGIETGITEDDASGTLVSEADSLIISTVGNIEPDNTMYVRFAGKLSKIESVEVVKPTDVTIMYKLFIGN